ncbi:hypothetical protein [Halomonas cerina]|uniref:Uncharacterized protein n=1 Tax=Halomonas cerina TaxID=447424 RepID=A0A839V1T3_9GAMM|nr:hypothetical protein [Halomonas cerina]MBB3189312.1 hypothetical protein [Halomonas cerina]
MTASNASIHDARKRRCLPGGWHRWGLSLLVVIALLLLLEGGHRWLEARSQAPLWRVIVAGEPLTLDAETHAAFSRDLTALTTQAEQKLAARMAPWVDDRLDTAFAPLEAAVPDYLDWYFSAPGSYTRLGVALMGDLDTWLDAQRQARLIAPSGIEEGLAELQAEYPQRLAEAQQGLAGELAASLHARYAPRQVTVEEGGNEFQRLDLDSLLDHALVEGLDSARWGGAVVGGSGLGLVAGRALTRRLGSRAAMQGGRMALRSLAARLGAGTARSLATGGAAAAVTAPTGPGAVVAGTLTTAVTLAGIVGSEVALLKLQETRHRPAMEDQLRQEFERTRAELADTLSASTAAAARAMQASLVRQAKHHETGEYRILGRRGE